MSTALHDIIGRFAGLHVLVIGEAMLDSYLEGHSQRLCREAPVPIVAVSARSDAAGGAANTAVNARSLGAHVTFLSVIGDDWEGRLLRRILDERGVMLAASIIDPRRETLAKQRVFASSQLLLRFDKGTTGAIDPETETALIDRLKDHFPRCDAVIVSDYGYGILTPGVIDAMIRLQSESPRILVADAKHLAAYRAAGLTAVKPNCDEALRILNLVPGASAADRVETIAAQGERLLSETGAKLAAVTLDTEGAFVFERGRPPYRTYAEPMPHSRAAGAGDTFLAAMTLALAAGAETPAVSELASAAAAVVVAKEGTGACTADELRERIAAVGKPIAGIGPLTSRLEAARREGRRIVFTNGCFDILHRGHITYLGRAKALGDLLIVGVNSDESIRRLKGPHRPINSLEDRLQVLAALSCVDAIVPFEDDTPCALIRAIRPDVFVKGGDYVRERLPEAPLVEEFGGVVQILPFVADHSTTDIIERIRAASTWPHETSTSWRTGKLPAGPEATASSNGCSHGADT